jgi:hypothetical protein
VYKSFTHQFMIGNGTGLGSGKWGEIKNKEEEVDVI